MKLGFSPRRGFLQDEYEMLIFFGVQMLGRTTVSEELVHHLGSMTFQVKSFYGGNVNYRSISLVRDARKLAFDFVRKEITQ